MEQGGGVAQPIGVVINHYNPGLDRKLTYQALHCVGTYLVQSMPVMVVLSDGSGIVDPILEQAAVQSGFHYLPSTKRLYFAEGYNAGINFLKDKLGESGLIALSANDIFPAALTLKYLQDCLLSEDRIGCAVPYMSYSDFPVQRDNSYPRRRLMRYMTLNLNLFRMADLSAIGGVPVEYSGYFNDIAMALKLAERGKIIALCYGGKVFHQHRSTTSVSTMASYEKDRTTFFAAYPWLISANPHTPLALSKLTSGVSSFFFGIWEMGWAASVQPVFVRLERWGLAVERWLYRNVYYPIYKRRDDPYKDVR